MKTKLEVRFDSRRCGIYEKYTTSKFHGESVDQFNEDNSSENNENEGGYDNSEVNMLKDACGVASMGLGIENEKDIEEHIHEQPTCEAAKFYRLLKEYQEPLSSKGETMSKLSYIVKLLHLKVLIPYNLPPSLCKKPYSFLLTLLILGPTSPGRNINVYLQPLIE